MKPVRLVVGLMLSLTIGGCATILGGTSQTLTVNSNVDGAQVFLNDVALGKTPLVARIKRGQEGTLKVEMAGYTPYQIAVNKKITSLFWLNIFSGGVTGSTTDAATGAMYEYEPSTYMVSLLPSSKQSVLEMSNWQRREGLRAFVLNNSEALASDLAAGHGEHIDVLIGIFAVKPVGRAEAIKHWRSVYTASKTSAQFAATMLADLGR